MARLRNILTALDEDDSDEAILKLVLETAARRDPELPDLLRACAIPRVVTAEIVGVLRGAPDDAAENSRLLDLVCAQSFVLRRPDHGFIFHDSTRDQLLADWQAPGDEARTARYTKLNNALVDYYKARYDHSLESDALLAKVGDLIYQANPARLRRLTAAIEATMAASLQEATYHLLLTSPDRALGFFESYYFALEEASRVTIVTALISFIRDFAARHPEAANAALLLWLDYYDARIKEVFPGYDPEPLIRAFAGLADNPDAPARLRDWALAALANVYTYKGDLSATLETRFRIVERDVIIDPHNEPLRYHALGELYWRLSDAERAIGYYQRCLARVAEVDEARTDLGVIARLALANVYAELGDWAAAFGSAAEALVVARRELWYDLQLTATVAVNFAQILGKLDARASDCAGTEAIGLAAATPHEVPGRLLDYVDVLLTAGRTRTAETWLSRAEAERYSPRSPLIRVDVLDRRGQVAWIEQRGQECEALCSELLAELPERPDTSYTRFVVLFRRGAQRDLLGDTEGAVSDYSLARAGFERLGCTTQAAVVAARLAGVMARSGDVAAARDFLAAAEAGIPQYPTDQYAELVEAAGDVAQAAADFTGAQAHFEQVLGLAAAKKDLVAQYMILGKLAALQERAGETELAAGYAKREAQARNQIAAHDVPAADGQRQAQEENRAGIRHYCRAEDRSVDLELARQHFTQARELDPENLWPALNLAFTCAGREAWLEAATALADAMELSPGPLRTAPALVDRLRDHVLLYLSNRFTRDHDSWAAKAAAAAKAVRRVAELLPPADLAPALAMQTVALVLSGDLTAGRTACREALSRAARGTVFTDAAAPLVVTLADYWALDDTLAAVEEAAAQAVERTGDIHEELRGKSAEAREALRERMDTLIGLSYATDPKEIPVPVPIVLEVGWGLVPIVDDRQDGGTFLFSLIPAMRDRIKARTGVTVPGVRARGNDNLPARGYNVQVDEIPVITGVLPAGAVARQAASAPEALTEPIDFNPRTGEPGVWSLRELASDEPPDASDPKDNGGDAIIALSAPEYLVNRIELAARAHLARYLGPQEVDELVGEWAKQPAEPGTVAPREVVPDAEAVLSLTWLLQRMVSDAVLITEWRQILTVVRDAGGLTVPSAGLYRAVRRGLRPLLPGPGTGRTPVELPSEYELPLTSANDGDTSTLPLVRRAQFLVWLRERIAETGPAITLITQTQESREAVAALARTQHRLVTALTREEADGNG